MLTGNLFESLSPPATPDERFDTLLSSGALRIERIVSWGQSTPVGEWYDQPQDEWVVLLSGAARLRFADAAETLDMRPGDWLYLPAHRKHRVEWTTPDQASVWLAIHFAAASCV